MPHKDSLPAAGNGAPFEPRPRVAATMTPHPPPPGPVVKPNYLTVEEALREVTFPITKRDLMVELDGATALLKGTNVDLRELVRDIPDDAFDTEDELFDAIEAAHGPTAETDERDVDAPRAKRDGKDVVEDAYEEMD